MRKQGSGLLIHVSSTTGRILVPFVSPYSAAKAALEGFAEEFSFELAPLGVESIIVEPGGFPTEGVLTGGAMTTAAEEAIAEEHGVMAGKPQEMDEGWGEAFSGPDAPDPQDVAEAVAELFAMSAASAPYARWSGR